MSKYHRTHSTVDKLPQSLRDGLMTMIVDCDWPDDFKEHYDGKPRIEDMIQFCKLRGYQISRSAMGRYCQQLNAITVLKNARLISRKAMKEVDSESASETQKAVSEMITAQMVDFITKHQDYSAKELRDAAKAMSDCTRIAINADKYIKEQFKQKAAAAAKNIENLAGKKEISPETLKMIREQIYGIVK